MDNTSAQRILLRNTGSYVGVLAVLYFTTRLNFVKEYVLNFYSTEFDQINQEPITNFYSQNPVVGFFNYLLVLFTDFGTSWTTGQPARPSVVPFIENSSMIISFAFIMTLVLSAIVLVMQEQMDTPYLTTILGSVLPVLVLSYIMLSIFLADPASYIYDGYIDKAYDQSSSKVQFHSIVLVMIFTPLLLRSAVAELPTARQFNSQVNRIAYLLSRALTKQFNLFLGLTIFVTLVLNAPTSFRQLVRSVQFVDLEIALVIAHSLITTYFIFLTLAQLISYFMVHLEQEKVAEYSDQTLQLVSNEVETENTPFNLLALIVPLVVSVTLGIIGLVTLGYYQELFVDTFPSTDVPPNLNPGEEGFPLGTTTEGLDVFALLTHAFYLILIAAIIAIPLRLAIAQMIHQFTPDSSQVKETIVNAFRYLPYFVLVPLLYVGYVRAGFGTDSLALGWALISSVIMWPIPYRLLSLEYSSNIRKYLLTCSAIFISVFVELFLIGLFIFDDTQYLLSTVILSLEFTPQYELLMLLAIVIPAIMMNGITGIQTDPTSKSEQKASKYYPETGS